MSTVKKIQAGKMDLEDFLSQLKQIKKLGPLENLLKLLPGARKMGLNNISIDPKQFSSLEAIISSMTIKVPSSFSDVPINLIGTPVKCLAERATPPLVSPSIL